MLSIPAFAGSIGTTNSNITYDAIPYLEGASFKPTEFGENHLIIKMNISGNLVPSTISLKSGDNLAWTINKLNKNDDIDVIDIRYLYTETYNETIYSVICKRMNYTIIANSTNTTILYDDCTDKPYTTQKTRDVWKSIDKGIQYAKGQILYIDFMIYKKPQVGTFKSDVIPSIYGLELSDLAWFSSDFQQCFDVNQTGITVNDYPTNNHTIYGGQVTIPCHYNSNAVNETRLVNSNCNNGGTSQPFQIGVTDNKTYAIPFWRANAVNNWSFYCNSTNSTDPNWGLIFVDGQYFDTNTTNQWVYISYSTDSGASADYWNATEQSYCPNYGAATAMARMWNTTSIFNYTQYTIYADLKTPANTGNTVMFNAYNKTVPNSGRITKAYTSVYGIGTYNLMFLRRQNESSQTDFGIYTTLSSSPAALTWHTGRTFVNATTMNKIYISWNFSTQAYNRNDTIGFNDNIVYGRLGVEHGNNMPTSCYDNIEYYNGSITRQNAPVTWTVSGEINGTAPPVDLCIYSSGNYVMPCGCNITAATNIGKNIWNITGAGTSNILARIYNMSQIIKPGSCLISINRTAGGLIW